MFLLKKNFFSTDMYWRVFRFKDLDEEFRFHAALFHKEVVTQSENVRIGLDVAVVEGGRASQPQDERVELGYISVRVRHSCVLRVERKGDRVDSSALRDEGVVEEGDDLIEDLSLNVGRETLLAGDGDINGCKGTVDLLSDGIGGTIEAKREVVFLSAPS